MQPVQCWEKVWTVPENAAPGSTFKIFKWVKTERKQQFSDDEEEVDQPLAPLPDEPEVVEVDEEMDQDDTGTPQLVETAPVSRAESEAVVPKDDTKPSSPKPHPLSVSFAPPPTEEDELDESLQPHSLEVTDTAGVGELSGDLEVGNITGDMSVDPLGGIDVGDIGGDISLDLSNIGPDGEPFEGAQHLTQLQPPDAILGEPLIDQTMEDDPFSTITDQ